MRSRLEWQRYMDAKALVALALACANKRVRRRQQTKDVSPPPVSIPVVAQTCQRIYPGVRRVSSHHRALP
jgi:hypothetical protein